MAWSTARNPKPKELLMPQRPTSILTTLAVSLLALTLIAPWALGQDLTETRRLAEQGDADAQYNLGFRYAIGEGVLAGQCRSRTLVPAGCRAGSRQCAVHARKHVRQRPNTRGVLEDDAEAVRWYRLSAEQGNADAQYNLGFRYAIGLGFPQDEAEAVRWFRLAAEQGNADAQNNLGVNGHVLKDEAEAVGIVQGNNRKITSAGTPTAVRWRPTVRSGRRTRPRRAQFYLGVRYNTGMRPQGRCRSRALVPPGCGTG